MPNTKVIDLSHWNTVPQSLDAAAAAGVLGVIHKCTEGTSSVDDKYGARRFLANQAGLHWGAYHFLRPGNMADQARHFLGAAQIDPATTLLAADHEDERVSLDDLAEWLREVETLCGRRPIIYSGHVLKDQLGGDRHPIINDGNFRLWLAQYGPEPKLPPGFDSYWLWQWTDRGTVPGVTPPTDCNDYQGTAAELAAEWNATGVDEAPPESSEEIGQLPTMATLTPEQFQIALRDAGFYDGEIDGQSGQMMHGAIDDWFEDGAVLDVMEEEEL